MLNTPTRVIPRNICLLFLTSVIKISPSTQGLRLLDSQEMDSRDGLTGGVCVIQRHHMFQLPFCSSKHQEQQTLFIILLMLQVIQSLAQEHPSWTEPKLRPVFSTWCNWMKRDSESVWYTFSPVLNPVLQSLIQWLRSSLPASLMSTAATIWTDSLRTLFVFVDEQRVICLIMPIERSCKDKNELLTITLIRKEVSLRKATQYQRERERETNTVYFYTSWEWASRKRVLDFSISMPLNILSHFFTIAFIKNY